MNDESRRFYFNNRPVDDWAWRWCVMAAVLPPEPGDDWDQTAGSRDVQLLAYRIDHEGVLESEEPAVFTFCILSVLAYLHDPRSVRVVKELSSAEVEDLTDALALLLELCREAGRAVWYRATAEELPALAEETRRVLLPVEDPDHQPPPHLEKRAIEVASATLSMRKFLHQRAQSGGLSKRIRGRLHGV